MRSYHNLSKILLVIEYDGTSYHGFQLQANVPTIQGELERALRKLSGEGVRVVAASRTDAGVHAKGQVVGFRIGSSFPAEVFVKALNYYLPLDIAVRRAYKVREDFDIRRNAVSREYQYYIINAPTRAPLKRDYAYFVPRVLDIETMNQACQILLGEHDFVSFATSMDTVGNTVRVVHKAKVEKEGDMVVFDMVANSFLPHQVRNTIGLLVDVGLGKVEVDEFRQILKSRKLGLAGPTAPAHGLFLTKVNYPACLGINDEDL